MRSKKIAIIIGVVIAVIITLISCLTYCYYKPQVISAIDQSFQITIPGNVKFKLRQITDDQYKLDLYSVKDEMFLTTTAVEKKQEIDLKEAVNQERVSLAQLRNEAKDISEVKEVNIKDYVAYQYNYKYYDKDFGSDIYCQVVWISTAKAICILDLEVACKNQKKYEPVFDKIMYSFEEKNM